MTNIAINTRIGVTLDIAGYNEETKVFDTPIEDKDGTPVELAGSILTLKMKMNGEPTVVNGLVSISPDNSTHLRWDLTGQPPMNKAFDLKIVRTDGLVIMIDGTISNDDRV